MKKQIQTALSLLLAFLMVFCLASCDIMKKESPETNTSASTSDNSNAGIEKTGLWATATYTQDTELGEGAKNVVVEVKVADQAVKFTIHTDKNTVGEALLEHELISGEEGAYGLYVKAVNGITADYDVDQSYWAFYVNGEYAMKGIELTEIDEGATYQLVYTK